MEYPLAEALKMIAAIVLFPIAVLLVIIILVMTFFNTYSDCEKRRTYDKVIRGLFIALMAVFTALVTIAQILMYAE